MSRIGFSGIFLGSGLFVTVIGVILFFIKTKAMKIYDLPQFLMIIGLGLILYGVVQLLGRKNSSQDVDVSSKAIRNFLVNNAIIFALLVMVVIIAIVEPRFIQIRVLKDILAQSSTKLIIALGISFTLLIGGTDLSAGRMVGLAAVVSASMMQTATYGNRFFPNLPQIPVIIPILLAIAVCLCFGLLNGFIVSRFSLPPFIGTLATQVIVYGACSLYFDMPPNNSQPIGGIRPDFSIIGQKVLFEQSTSVISKIPILIPIAIVITIFVWFLLNKTVFGKNIYAIGGNVQAATVSGINVRNTILGLFVLASGFYAIGGILEAARTAGATNNYGFGYELDAIAACVVGGVSLNGGVGKVRGIVIGVLIFTVIQYGLSFIGLNPYWQQVIKGIIIIVAVAVDLTKNSRR